MDETLKYFLDTIAERAAQDQAEKNEAFSKRYEASVDSVRQQVEQQADSYREAQIAQIRSAGKLKVAALRTENHRKLLEYREACAAQTLEEVKQKLLAYTQTPEYRERLVALVGKAAGALDASGGLVVYLRHEDMRQGDYIKSKLRSCSVSVKEGSFALGGVIVESPSLCRRADLSFDTALNETQSRFAELVGMELQ